MLKLGCLLALAVLIAIPTAALYLLPPKTAALVIVGFFVALYFLVPRLIGTLTKGYVQLAGRKTLAGLHEMCATLNGATVTLHQVAEVPAPARADADDEEDADEEESDEDDEDEDDEDEEGDAENESDESEGPFRHVLIDCTITPPAGSETEAWTPSLLLLAQGEVPLVFTEMLNADNMDKAARQSEQLSGDIVTTRTVSPDGFEARAPADLSGEVRLRLVYRIPMKMTGTAKLRYLIHDLADIPLPDPQPQSLPMQT